MTAVRSPNLLILGASGGVARAVLQGLAAHRGRFGTVLLLDRRSDLVADPGIDLNWLRARFLRVRLNLPMDTAWFGGLLRRHRIDLVLDLSTIDTLQLLDAVDAEGVSLINTALCHEKLHLDALVAAVVRRPPRWTSAPHLLCSGMNPGLVNLWAMHGVAKFGRPREIVVFEFDTSRPAVGWRPSITWSPHEFLNEAVREPSGRVVGGRVEWFAENPLKRREDLRPWLEPFWTFDRYPHALTILHEENVTLGQRLGVSSRFLYAIDPQTMAFLERRWQAEGKVRDAELLRADNVRIPLIGGEHIGVCLDYEDRRVYYVNDLPNAVVRGTNATCAQVAVGVYAALLTWLADRLAPGVHFAGDLTDTAYRQHAFDGLRVEQHVLRRRGRRWARVHFAPGVRWTYRIRRRARR